MPIRLVDALGEVLTGWQDDLPAVWQPLARGVELGFEGCDKTLELQPWEPIFPARRGRTFPGAPAGSHMLRAFDDLAPPDVRCVILGQDPYPAAEFATGRAFEAGNLAGWRELDKMFSKSVRAFVQLICAARTGNPDLADSFAAWPGLLAAIEDGTVPLEGPDRLADRWVGEGVLLLNSSLTLSRFAVEVDPHQSRGHLPVWRPLILAVLRTLAASGRPIAFLGFGDVAAENLAQAGLPGLARNLTTVLRPHPAAAEEVLGQANPFLIANRHLEHQGAGAISW